MRLFVNPTVREGLEDFEVKLSNYFAESRRFRSSLRRGKIILLDANDKMFRFLDFVVSKCGLSVGVIHIDDAANARKAIEAVGVENVKAVIIDSGMVGDSINGESLPSWLGKEHPKIPIWVVNCDEKKVEWIKSQTYRIGVISEKETLSGVATEIGLPKECGVAGLAFTV